MNITYNHFTELPITIGNLQNLNEMHHNQPICVNKKFKLMSPNERYCFMVSIASLYKYKPLTEKQLNYIFTPEEKQLFLTQIDDKENQTTVNYKKLILHFDI